MRQENSSSIPPELIAVLADSQRITVLTGAGISAESGVPTFREAQRGLWARYDPEELATPEAFRTNPGLVWEWYAWRRELVAAAAPNAGHFALVELENLVPEFTLITQNVDGYHRAAGSRAVIELHGNIGRVKCVGEGHVEDRWDEDSGSPPKCPRCGSLLRPDVVWFGETLPDGPLLKAIEAAQHSDLFISVGTSALVQPAASLPLIASRNGAITLEINPESTPISGQMSYRLRGKAAMLLPLLVGRVRGMRDL